MRYGIWYPCGPRTFGGTPGGSMRSNVDHATRNTVLSETSHYAADEIGR
jgi:hypothetical protein